MRLRAAASLELLLPGSDAGVDVLLVPQVIGNGAVDLLERQGGEVVPDRFCGVAAQKAVDD
jgi:hypothetical protein